MIGAIFDFQLGSLNRVRMQGGRRIIRAADYEGVGFVEGALPRAMKASDASFVSRHFHTGGHAAVNGEVDDQHSNTL